MASMSSNPVGEDADSDVGGYEIGDLVERRVNVYKSDSPKRLGVVTRRYSDLPHYPELYEVRWDTEAGNLIEPLFCKGYLRHGLTLVRKVAIMTAKEVLAEAERRYLFDAGFHAKAKHAVLLIESEYKSPTSELVAAVTLLLEELGWTPAHIGSSDGPSDNPLHGQ